MSNISRLASRSEGNYFACEKMTVSINEMKTSLVLLQKYQRALYYHFF